DTLKGAHELVVGHTAAGFTAALKDVEVLICKTGIIARPAKLVLYLSPCHSGLPKALEQLGLRDALAELLLQPLTDKCGILPWTRRLLSCQRVGPNRQEQQENESNWQA